MDVIAMPKAPSSEHPTTLTERINSLPERINSLPEDTTPKLTGSKGAQVQACEGAGNTAEVLQSSSDHLLDTAATQQLYRGLNLAFS